MASPIFIADFHREGRLVSEAHAEEPVGTQRALRMDLVPEIDLVDVDSERLRELWLALGIARNAPGLDGRKQGLSWYFEESVGVGSAGSMAENVALTYSVDHRLNGDDFFV